MNVRDNIVVSFLKSSRTDVRDNIVDGETAASFLFTVNIPNEEEK